MAQANKHPKFYNVTLTLSDGRTLEVCSVHNSPIKYEVDSQNSRVYQQIKGGVNEAKQYVGSAEVKFQNLMGDGVDLMDMLDD